jgi:SAM-dependent methyltransferase
MVMRRITCGGCDRVNLSKILDLGVSPLADQFPATVEESHQQVKYPLDVYVCQDCRLVQLGEIVPDEILFGHDYGFYSGTSKSILTYYSQYAQFIADRYADERERARKSVLEIACNDGGLLKELRGRGFEQVAGIDPSSGPAKQAQTLGFDVTNQPFNNAWAQHHTGEYDIVIANHVAAHVTDLRDFLTGVATVLSKTGSAFIEFQYLPDLLVGNMLDHVYHEHRFFFSVTSFRRAAQRVGLTLVNATWVDRQGGSMRVELSHSNKYPYPEVASEEWLLRDAAYTTLQSRTDRMFDRLQRLLRPRNGLLAGYGAPAKATTLIHAANIDRGLMPWVEDTTPVKIGRLMPGTDIPIISPDQRPYEPHEYILFTWNYISEIMHKETAFLANGGRFIVPIPFPVVI